MQAYRARYERGRIIPLGDPVIPEGSEMIITILDAYAPESPAERQRKALSRFWEDIRDCGEVVPDFERVAFREVEV
jgi:hypothetical protein